jgi:hypothetical protein
MSGIRLLERILLVLTTLGAAQICNAAFADVPNKPPSNAELFALIQSLQTRVTALETQADEYKKEAEAAQAALKQI